MKRILAGVLALTMVFGSLAMPAAESGFSVFDTAVTASAETYGDYIYWVLDDGTVKISSYTGNGGAVTIPSTIDGKKVTTVSSTSFNSNPRVTSVTIPDSVTIIESSAFANCRNLSSITIPDSVTSIGGGAFGDTLWLENKRKENPLVVINGILIDGKHAVEIFQSLTVLLELNHMRFSNVKALQA
ncbi:MAG: leucine-rich repeat domain-containing protein [Oscillospiraceae bacterium]